MLCPRELYRLFNHLGLWRLQVDQSSVRVAMPAAVLLGQAGSHKDPNSSACVRCLECAKACPTGALTFSRALSGLQVRELISAAEPGVDSGVNGVIECPAMPVVRQMKYIVRDSEGAKY